MGPSGSVQVHAAALPAGEFFTPCSGARCGSTGQPSGTPSSRPPRTRPCGRNLVGRFVFPVFGQLVAELGTEPTISSLAHCCPGGDPAPAPAPRPPRVLPALFCFPASARGRTGELCPAAGAAASLLARGPWRARPAQVPVFADEPDRSRDSSLNRPRKVHGPAVDRFARECTTGRPCPTPRRRPCRRLCRP